MDHPHQAPQADDSFTNSYLPADSYLLTVLYRKHRHAAPSLGVVYWLYIQVG